jgi:hypothetical protein
MISIVIPTLWKGELIHETVSSFLSYENKQGSEIIIIDNANSDYVSPNPEYIKVIKMKENIFVNPAWNLGVSLAKNQHVCLLNDDIYVNVKTWLDNFYTLVYKPKLNYGIIALNAENFKFYKESNADTDKYELEELTVKGVGFGMMMTVQKHRYYPIPECFRVYFGDDYIWYVVQDLLKLKSYYLKDMKLKGDFSVTSKEYENTFLQEEEKFWHPEVDKITKQYLLSTL